MHTWIRPLLVWVTGQRKWRIGYALVCSCGHLTGLYNVLIRFGTALTCHMIFTTTTQPCYCLVYLYSRFRHLCSRLGALKTTLVLLCCRTIKYCDARHVKSICICMDVINNYCMELAALLIINLYQTSKTYSAGCYLLILCIHYDTSCQTSIS